MLRSTIIKNVMSCGTPAKSFFSASSSSAGSKLTAFCIKSGVMGARSVPSCVTIARREYNSTGSGWADLKESAVFSDKETPAPEQKHTVGADGIPRNTKSVDDEPSEKLSILIDKILDLDVIEMNQMLRRLQKRLGITDEMLYARRSGMGGGGGDGGGGGGEAAAAAAAPVVEKTAFTVKLAGFDAKSKIKIIKEVRANTGLGLKEAKELVESAPCVIKEGLSKEDSDALQKILTDNGGTVEIL